MEKYAETNEQLHILNKDKNYFFLYSGGLDSSYGLLDLLVKNEITAQLNIIFFDYGQKAALHEWQAVKKVYSFLKENIENNDILQPPLKFDLRSDLFCWTESVSFTGKDYKPNNGKFSVTEIENRNMVIFSILYSYILSLINRQNISQCEIIIYTGLRNKELPDASESFFFHINEAMEEYHKEYLFKIEYIIDKTPKQILNELKKNKLGLNTTQILEFVRSVSSCYRPNDEGKPCFTCPKCESIDSVTKFITNDGRF